MSQRDPTKQLGWDVVYGLAPDPNTEEHAKLSYSFRPRCAY